MKQIFALLSCFLLVNAEETIAQEIDYKGFPEWSWHKEGDTEYYLYTPRDIMAGEKYPVAVFLHGCCGQDDHATLRNAVDPPARMWHAFGENEQREPTFIITPKTTRGWSQKFPDIKKVVDDLISSGKADPQRIYMTGFSMGGAGTWQFIEQYPAYLAAAIPMGMSARADLEKIKDTPIWTIRGELDYHAQKLDSQVAVIRKLNGDPRGPLEWATGVNPLYTSFEGLGHGIQWEAASSLDLLDWAYSQVNDGNIAPVVFFIMPTDLQYFAEDEEIGVSINAHDPDGRIRQLLLNLNGETYKLMREAPYETGIKLKKGDNLLEAVATDNGGKTSIARMTIRTDVEPAFDTDKLPGARVGEYYAADLEISGNAPFQLQVDQNGLPAGLRVEGSRITGVPEKKGNYVMKLTALDHDGQQVDRDFPIVIGEKSKNRVVVTDVHSTADSLINRVSVLYKGQLPNLQAGTEVSFSETAGFDGMTYIATSQNQAKFSGDDVLSFSVDEDAVVYVAYERLDNLFRSTIPDWLKDYEHLDGKQIVAQYHYFDVYRKPFPKGRISLPGAETDRHNVIRNYFVMVEKQQDR